jgi:GT2 family glycosyltransferase
MGTQNVAGRVDGADKPRVTIIVTPRERWGMAQRSLESIYEKSDIPFELIVVDAGSPPRLSDWLKKESAVKGFRIIHLDRFVTPNEARNLGAAASTTEYVVFIDNDVICADGWLSAAIRCGDETGADVIAPLVCEGLPLHSRVHQATGTFAEDKEEFFSAKPGERVLIDVMAHHGTPLEKVRDQLHRAPTDSCEFHCVVVRRSILDRVGPLDEELYATKEHIDFCMLVVKAGGKLVFEPTSIVTYVFPSRANPITKEDIPYFLLRWSPKWQLHSLHHIQKKWGLAHAAELAYVSEPDYMRVRQYEGYIKPLIRKIPVVRDSWRLTQAARKILTKYVDHKVEGLAAEYERQRAVGRASTAN